MIYGVFDVREPERCRYVGLTRSSLRRRSNSHWSYSRNPRSTIRPINSFLQKRKRDDVCFRVLEEAEDEFHMKTLERFWIAQYRELGMADLNITDGGESGSGMKKTPAQRSRQSEISRSNWANPEWAERQRARIKAGLNSPEYLAFAREHSKRIWAEGKHRPKFGVENPASKLNPEKVLEIVEKVDSGRTFASVADEFNVNVTTVSNIIRGKTWKEVTGR